jgi:hypothetical protein
MRTLKQPAASVLVRKMLARAIIVAAVSACSVAAWAQGAAPGNAASKASVAPPPADLEPGVNTSATQPSSAEPAPAPAPAPKPAQSSAKRAPANGATGSTVGGTGSAPSGATVGGSSAAAAGATGVSSGAAPSGATAGGSGASSSATKAGRGATTAGSTASAGATAAAPKAGAAAGKAHDSIELDTTQITGNRELPKVLYIVPWKRSDLGDLVGKPVNSLLDEVLQPVDRDVFKRQNRYYDALKPDDAKDAAGAAPGSPK